MKRRYDKILCIITAWFILLSGMCLEVPQADSLFACIDNSSSTSYMSSPEGTLSQYELSSRETIGVRGTAFISSISRRPILRTTLRISLIMFWAEIFLLKTSNLQRAAETVCAPETHYFTALLNYIHRQDGKKIIFT